MTYLTAARRQLMRTEIQMHANSIRKIQDEVCKRYGLTMQQLVGKQRCRKYAWPRQEGYFLASIRTTASLPMIGYAFGNRDHTTVIYGIRVYKERLAKGRREAMEKLKMEHISPFPVYPCSPLSPVSVA